MRVALIGCGAWGKNILRVVAESPRASVVAVADVRPSRLAIARGLAPDALLVTSAGEALAARPDAVLIATPASSHAELALAAMRAGADVFVEKPLAMNVADAERCVAESISRARVGMVGHLLRYHPAIADIIRRARGGEIGTLRTFDAARLSSAAGGPSVLWALGPHDLSILHAIDPSPLESITATTLGPDRAVIDATLASGVVARIALARRHATKERRFRIEGSRGSLGHDDVRAPHAGAAIDRFREPLAVEIDAFLDSVETRCAPLTPFEEGALVVGWLSRALRASRGEKANGGKKGLEPREVRKIARVDDVAASGG